MTARNDKAPGGRTEAAAVDQAIADVREGIAFSCDAISEAIGEGCGECDGCKAYAALRVLADAVEELREKNARERKARKAVEGVRAEEVVAARTNLSARLEAAEAERDRLVSSCRRKKRLMRGLVDKNFRLARQVADLEAFYETAKKYVEAETADEEALGRLLDGTDDDNLDERYRDEQKATRHEADRLFDELRAAARSRDPQEGA